MRKTKGITEDMAPAERKKIQKALEEQRFLEQQKRIEEMIAIEKEKDPDALDADIREKVFIS